MMKAINLVSGKKRCMLFNNQYTSLLDSSKSHVNVRILKLPISYNNMEYKVVNAKMLTYSYYFLV